MLLFMQSGNITLTVQPCGNGKYRLGINAKDSQSIFMCRGARVDLIICKMVLELKTSCGKPCGNEVDGRKYKKGYDLYHKDLDCWLNEKGYVKYCPSNPTKLTFSYCINENGIIKLTFISALQCKPISRCLKQQTCYRYAISCQLPIIY